MNHTSTIRITQPVKISNTDRHIPPGDYPATLISGIAKITLQGENIILRKSLFEVVSNQKTPAP